MYCSISTKPKINIRKYIVYHTMKSTVFVC